MTPSKNVKCQTKRFHANTASLSLFLTCQSNPLLVGTIDTDRAYPTTTP